MKMLVNHSVWEPDTTQRRERTKAGFLNMGYMRKHGQKRGSSEYFSSSNVVFKAKKVKWEDVERITAREGQQESHETYTCDGTLSSA